MAQSTVKSNKQMANKVAVVTGGASGFGRESANLFAQAGARVVIWDVNDAGGQDAVNSIKKNGGEAVFAHVDVASSANVKKAAADVKKQFGTVDILVNSAGTVQYAVGTVPETTEEEYDRVMDINVKGTFLTSKYIIPLMEKNGGTIVNIASTWGHTASNRAPIYCTSKGAVEQITRAMAIDHAPDKIRVNCVCPGTCRTPLVEKMANENYKIFGFDSPDEVWEARAKAHPIGRVGTAIDIAKVIFFLSTEDAGWMTGSIVAVDGGYTLGKVYAGKHLKRGV